MMAGWVRGIRQVTLATVPVDEYSVGHQRGPVVTKEERVITDLPASVFARMLSSALAIDLPMTSGAGPCGTCAIHRPRGLWALRWTRLYLVDPLRHYYATYEPPMRFGAKPGPRGRRAS